MPVSVIIAAASSYAAAATVAALGLASGTFAALAVGAAASMVVGGILSKALRPGQTGSPSGPGFTAEAQGRDQMVRSSTATRTIVYGQSMVSGPLVFAAASGTKNDTIHLVVPVANHEIFQFEKIFFNDEDIVINSSTGAVNNAKYAGHVKINLHHGTPGQQADGDLVALGQGWTTAHKLSGIAYVVVRLTFSTDVFPTGIPNIKCQIKGKKVYDPRNGSTVWSANPALCARDYLVSNYGLRADTADIDDAMVVAAANVCDELISRPYPLGNEYRYTCNGVVNLDSTPRSVMESIMSSMAGFMVFTGGKYKLHAGAYTAPTVTLTADDLRASVRVRPHLSRTSLFNAVRGTFVDPSNYWQPNDFPTVSNSTYASQDGGEVIWRDMALPYTTSTSTAQRIAKIMLERSRQGITVELSCKLTAFKISTLDTVMVTLSQMGWAAKEFKVLEWKLSPDGGVDLTLQEETAASYQWNSGMETVVDPAPDTNLPNAFSISAPGAPNITENLYETTGSAGVKTRALVSWVQAQDAFVSTYLLEYKKTEEGTWTVTPVLRDTQLAIEDLEPRSYQFRVRAVNTMGVRSAYSPITTKTLLGLTAPPADVVNFSVSKISGIAIANWNLIPDLDVRIGGRIVIRHSAMSSGATWADGIILEEFGGDSVTGVLPLIGGTYMAKAKDSTGTFSTNAVFFVATEGLITGYNTVATIVQAPDFLGAKTNMAVLDGALRLDSVGTIATYPGLVSTWPKIGSLGGISTSGEYEFDAVYDFGSVATRRFSSEISTLSFDTGDTIAWRGLVSEWDSVTGTTVNDCDLTLYAATTQDNPAVSPTWSDWTPYFVTEFTCRAIKHRIDVTSASPTHNLSVSTLTVRAKVPA
jgi:hypothetical protein